MSGGITVNQVCQTLGHLFLLPQFHPVSLHYIPVLYYLLSITTLTFYEWYIYVNIYKLFLPFNILNFTIQI